MIEFIDDKTPLNRANMMGIQGFISKKYESKEDGSIVVTNANGEVLTYNFGENMSEKFEGEKTITKTYLFGTDGTVEEVIS